VPGNLLARYLLVWTSIIILLVAYKAATGQINLRGLLSDDAGQFSPERAQLLLTTLAGVTAFTQFALENGISKDPPTLVLAGVGGSQALYVVAKYVRQIFNSK
jgi:hypothetical protein